MHHSGKRDARLSALPEKPLAWLPPENPSGYKENPPIRDGLLTLMVDLADNLGPHTERAQQITLCCDGLVVSGRLIGAKEYFDGMRETVLEGAGELMAGQTGTRQRRHWRSSSPTPSVSLSASMGTTYDFYEPDDRRESPDYIHLAEATVHYGGSTRDVRFWRGRLSAVSSFWTE